MKNYLWSFVLTLVVLNLSACNLGDGAKNFSCNVKFTTDAYEPNDKPEDATPLSGEITATFGSENMPDYCF